MHWIASTGKRHRLRSPEKRLWHADDQYGIPFEAHLVS